MSDIWYLLRDAERYVYHYTRAFKLALNILPRGELRLSRFQCVNDPRESKDWRLSYNGPSDRLNFHSRKLELEINGALKHSWRIGCFVIDPPKALYTHATASGAEMGVESMYERGALTPKHVGALWRKL